MAKSPATILAPIRSQRLIARDYPHSAPAWEGLDSRRGAAGAGAGADRHDSRRGDPHGARGPRSGDARQAGRDRQAPICGGEAVIAALPPYAALLGLRTERGEAGERLWIMPFAAPVVGRPGFLHGGAIAGLLEFAALGTLYDALEEGVRVKPIDVSVDFMRGGVDHDTFASATITRLGYRAANVEAHAWQQDRARPIAAARMNLLLR